MESSETFRHKNESCCYCNGYYGSCFGQPVCAACHALLYPDDASQRIHNGPNQEKTDDGDSGNEEPKEPSDFHQMQQDDHENLQQPPQQQLQQPLLPPDGIAWGNRHQLVEDAGEVELPEGAVAMPPPDPSPVNTGDAGMGSQSRIGGNILVNETLKEIVNQLTCPRLPDNSDPSLVHRIPPEVLLIVFNLLDDVTLWSVDKVCQRWHNLVLRYVGEDQWKEFTKRRWPLFRPLYSPVPWQQVYTKLTESAPCQMCLYQMLPANPPTNENSWRRNRLRNELKTLRSDPPEGIEASPLDEMSLHWQASIRGPAGSPYEGGTFFLYIQIPPSYPLCPPIVRFITKIFHPNVSRHGNIGIDSIQHNWSLALTISKVLISIQSLLTDPYTKVCMEPEIGRLYESNRNLFEKASRAWTHRHAMHDGLISDSPPSTLPRPSCSRFSQMDTDEGIVSTSGLRGDLGSAT